MTSRRSFLLGIGALVSASFVTRVKAHVLESARPLLLEPKRAEETLYLYDHSGWDDDWKWRVSLGPDDLHEPPPPPTWREHLRPLGYTFDTQQDYDRALREMSLEPEDVDKHLDGYGWASYWEHNETPQAKAAILLKELKLDCALHARGDKAGLIYFTEWGGHPGSCERWVDLKDDLTVSILQARLIERDLPIKLVVGSL
jgi:hypothetical protein